MVNDTSTPAAAEFAKEAQRVKESMDAAIKADDSMRVRITETHFQSILLPIFTAISQDEHPNLDPWYSIAKHQHACIEVYASAGGQYGEYPDYNQLLFIVPPILERFAYSQDNAQRAVAVLSANDPKSIPEGMNGSVAYDLTTYDVNNKNRLTGFMDNDETMKRSILFGIAMSTRYGLAWFTDPETGKRYKINSSETTVAEPVDVTEYQETIDIGDLEEL